jgi:hypothetical protein
MKNARRFLLDQFEIGITQREARYTDVAFNDLKVADVSVTELTDALDLFSRTRKERRLDEQDKIARVSLAFAREAFQQAVGDETRKPGYE